jgi:hypothetical protein
MIDRAVRGLRRVSRRALIYPAIYRRFSAYTMIPRPAYLANLGIAERYSHVPGAVVECGTWRGGMVAGIATLIGNRRRYFLFDSFEGLPPAKPVDGEMAQQWQADTAGPAYYDNCTASESDARAAMARAGVEATIAKGWFKDTLPHAQFAEGISILRMDADWYESTMDILSSLFDQVTPGGVIIVDDYYTWEGCSKAVHDFLSQRQRQERIYSRGGVAYIVKC